MGRLPVIQNDAGRDKVGRDHNTYGFTIWLAGGGIKGGYDLRRRPTSSATRRQGRR